MFDLKELMIGYENRSRSMSLTSALDPQPICFIFGANGSGKSTLLRTLAGLQAPLQGQVLLSGERLKKTSSISARPAYLPTQMEFGDYLTGNEILEISGFDKSPWCKRSMIDSFQLGRLLNRPAHQLSTGEMKRLLILSVLAHPSKMVLLDEPLNSLDWHFEFQLSSLIEDQVKMGRKFVICNHDFNWALRFKMSHCWVLQDFCRILAGPTEAIFIHEKFRAAFHFQTQLTDNPLDGTRLLALAPLKKQ